MIALIIFLGIVVIWIGLVIATDRRDKPKPQLPVKPQVTLLAEEVITVSRRRTVRATRG